MHFARVLLRIIVAWDLCILPILRFSNTIEDIIKDMG